MKTKHTPDVRPEYEQAEKALWAAQTPEKFFRAVYALMRTPRNPATEDKADVRIAYAFDPDAQQKIAETMPKVQRYLDSKVVDKLQVVMFDKVALLVHYIYVADRDNRLISNTSHKQLMIRLINDIDNF